MIEQNPRYIDKLHQQKINVLGSIFPYNVSLLPLHFKNFKMSTKQKQFLSSKLKSISNVSTVLGDNYAEAIDTIIEYLISFDSQCNGTGSNDMAAYLKELFGSDSSRVIDQIMDSYKWELCSSTVSNQKENTKGKSKNLNPAAEKKTNQSKTTNLSSSHTPNKPGKSTGNNTRDNTIESIMAIGTHRHKESNKASELTLSKSLNQAVDKKKTTLTSHQTKKQSADLIIFANGSIISQKKKRRCGCMATRHPMIASCINCGRITCEMETSIEDVGACLFCGAFLQLTISSDDAVALNLNDKTVAAYRQKDKLLQFDKENAKRTQVHDAQVRTTYNFSSFSEL